MTLSDNFISQKLKKRRFIGILINNKLTNSSYE